MSAQNHTRRPGQHDGETAIEYLRRVVHNCNYETESLLDDLPSVEAVIEFFELWHAYGTDFWSGVCECIATGDDPARARAFLDKWSLTWELPTADGTVNA